MYTLNGKITGNIYVSSRNLRTKEAEQHSRQLPNCLHSVGILMGEALGYIHR